MSKGCTTAHVMCSRITTALMQLEKRRRHDQGLDRSTSYLQVHYHSPHATKGAERSWARAAQMTCYVQDHYHGPHGTRGAETS
jgi:hypothetical protein